MNIKTPTPIQEQAIPVILNGNDIVACAQTGTGKTAAYILPVIHKIVSSTERHLNTLILAPTRELAQQIDQQIDGLSYFISISSISIYGGGDGIAWEQQKKALDKGADIITATPGRLIAQLTSGKIDFSKLQHLILDEADKMLDMGFYDDIMRIVNYLPKQRQTLLFSATMPPKIRTLANVILNNPKEITIAISKPADKINQQAYILFEQQKDELLRLILEDKKEQSIIIFVSTKETVKKLHYTLNKLSFTSKAFHSDLEQNEREEILREFKSKKLKILIGTDILSRGIDVEGINLVINYDVPPDPEDYVHRIGRTARASSEGTAITFVNEKDQYRFHKIEKLIKAEVSRQIVPEKLGSCPEYNPEKNKKMRSFGRRKPFFKAAKRP